MQRSHFGGRDKVRKHLQAIDTHLNIWLMTYRTGQFTVMLNCWEAFTPVLSVTVSVNVKVPVAVGVPLIVVTPFDPLVTARPGGSCPAVIDQVQAWHPPLPKGWVK